LGLIFNFANPSGISLIPLTWLHKSPPLIEVQLAKTKYDSKTALLVDARPQVFYNQRHIPGAVNLPLSLFDFIYMMRFSNIDSQKEIIVYGKSFSRQYDKEVALKLTARGHTNVMVLAGTLSVWGKEGYPLGP
jgi:3-mercaptopyruvate sulfurtransferase SseA